MPFINSQETKLEDGRSKTEVSGTATATETGYDFRLPQDAIYFENKGNSDIILKVNNVTYTVPAGNRQNVPGDIDSLTVQSSENTPFTITSWGKLERPGSSLGVIQTTLMYSRAITDIKENIPRDALTKARTQIKSAGALKVAFWGDSITEGIDQVDPADAYPQRLLKLLKNTLPNVTITMGNFSLASRGLAHALTSTYKGTAAPDNVGTGFYRAAPWGDGNGSVIGKSWADHVKDFSPDLVIIAFGMNDSGPDTTASNIDESTKNSLKALLDSMAAWPSNPSVVLTTVFLPTTNLSLYNQGQIKTNSIARATREYGAERKVTVADVNRLYRILRDGLDEGTTVYTQEKDFGSFNDPNVWVSSGFTRSGTTSILASASGTPSFTRKIRAYNGFIQVDAYMKGYGAAYGQWIDFRKNNTTGERLTFLVYPNSANGATDGYVEFYSSDSQTLIATATALNIPPNAWNTIRVEFNGTKHKLLINGTSVLSVTSYKKLIEGEINVKAISSGGGADYRNITIGIGALAETSPAFTETDLLGIYNSIQSGNAINHPTGLGHALFYLPAFYGLVDMLADKNDISAASALTYIYGPIKVGTWLTPDASYPSSTSSGENLYYVTIAVDASGSNSVAQLRKTDTGDWWTRNTQITPGPGLTGLLPGQFVRYSTMLFISWPSGQTPPTTFDLWQNRNPLKV